MIFGKTQKQKETERIAREFKMLCGIRKFAFFPRQLENGQFVWLEHYYAFYRGEINPQTKVAGVYGYEDGPRSYKYLTSDWVLAEHITPEQRQLMREYSSAGNQSEVKTAKLINLK